MSVVLPADLADLMAGVDTDLVQELIDRAEATVAERLGIPPHLIIAAGGTQGEIQEGVAVSPIGERALARTYTISVASNLFELPEGPLAKITVLTANAVTALDPFADPPEILVGPWSIRWPDRSVKFIVGATLKVEGLVGWTVSTLPERVRQAVHQTVTSLYQSSEHTGPSSSGEVKSERLGPFAASYVTSADSSSGSSETPEGATGANLPQLDDLLRPWMRPDFGI